VRSRGQLERKVIIGYLAHLATRPDNDRQAFHWRDLYEELRSGRHMSQERLREIALDPTNVVIVEGGPGVDKTWLVVEVPRRVRRGHGQDGIDAGDGLRRLRFDDALARISTLAQP